LWKNSARELTQARQISGNLVSSGVAAQENVRNAGKTNRRRLIETDECTRCKRAIRARESLQIPPVDGFWQVWEAQEPRKVRDFQNHGSPDFQSHGSLA
jgi:hypothetical protein